MELPAIAQITQNSKMAAPARNVGLRASSRHLGVVPDGVATATAAPGCAIVMWRLPWRLRWQRRAAAG